MKLCLNKPKKRHAAGFSIVEIVVAAALIAIMFGALLSGLTSSVAKIQFGREQMRATQIMVEKMDTLRLYSWGKLNTTYIPTGFTNSFHPGWSKRDGSGAGTTYYGTITINNPPVTEPYAPDLREVVVTLKWVSSKRTVTRQMKTLVAKNGLSNYIK